jgi:hypothetical protein
MVYVMCVRYLLAEQLNSDPQRTSPPFFSLSEQRASASSSAGKSKRVKWPAPIVFLVDADFRSATGVPR